MLYIKQKINSNRCVNLHKVNCIKKYIESNIFKLFFNFDKDSEYFSFETEEDLNLAIKKIDKILSYHTKGMFILDKFNINQ